MGEDLEAQLKNLRNEMEDIDGEIAERRVRRKNVMLKMVRIGRDNPELARKLGTPTSMPRAPKAVDESETSEGESTPAS